MRGSRHNFSKNFSVPIFRPAILVARLEIVVLFAQALPVALIPEQLLVSTMRNDVVNHSGLHIPSFLHALDAQGMRVEILLSCLLPCAVVASAASRPHFLRVDALVLLTELCPIRHKSRASRMLAWRVWAPGHQLSQGRPCFPKCPRELTLL